MVWVIGTVCLLRFLDVGKFQAVLYGVLKDLQHLILPEGVGFASLLFECHGLSF